MAPSPVVALNRAVAVAEVEGPTRRWRSSMALDLGDHHLFHAIRADLLRRAGRDRGRGVATLRRSRGRTTCASEIFCSAAGTRCAYQTVDPMRPAYLAVTILFALMTAFSALMKIRRDPNIVKIIHETVGVPMQYLPWLAVCELAGALGLVIGILYPPLGIAAGAGLIIYFAGAVVSHVRVGDFKGIGAAVFMLALSIAAVALRLATMR